MHVGLAEYTSFVPSQGAGVAVCFVPLATVSSFILSKIRSQVIAKSSCVTFLLQQDWSELKVKTSSVWEMFIMQRKLQKFNCWAESIIEKRYILKTKTYNVVWSENVLPWVITSVTALCEEKHQASGPPWISVWGKDFVFLQGPELWCYLGENFAIAAVLLMV